MIFHALINHLSHSKPENNLLIFRLYRWSLFCHEIQFGRFIPKLSQARELLMKLSPHIHFEWWLSFRSLPEQPAFRVCQSFHGEYCQISGFFYFTSPRQYLPACGWAICHFWRESFRQKESPSYRKWRILRPSRMSNTAVKGRTLPGHSITILCLKGRFIDFTVQTK